ncbi:MAG: hypothetical protein ACR2NN_06215 [Bryobacteraceae bacterium]
MDVHKALQELYLEKRRLDVAIAQLEAMQGSSVHEVVRPPRCAGRKAMTAEERQAVSRRMIDYWADRKTATA